MMATPGMPTGGDGTPQPARTPTALTAAHSKIPDALQTFRSREPKALGVALLMLGIILFVTVIPLIKTIPSAAIQNGAPFYAAALLGISGSLTIVSEKNPGKVKLKACLACTVLSAVVSVVQMVVYLVDLNKFKVSKSHCLSNTFDRECHRAATQQKQLFAYVPVFYLLTFSGMMLSIILSISLCDVLRSWNPEMDRPDGPAMTTPSDPEGAALISVDQGYIPLEEPQRIPAPRPTVQRPSQPVRSGKKSLLVQKFLEAQPKMLGVVHIVLALCLILITMPYLILLTYEEMRLGIMWWLVIQCIVSGVLSIAAEDRPTINMIRACMTLNIISAIAASFVAILFQTLTSATITCLYRGCETDLETIVAVFPLIFLLLSITISVVIATYARKSLRSMTLSKTTVVMNPPSAQGPRDELVGTQ